MQPMNHLAFLCLVSALGLSGCNKVANSDSTPFSVVGLALGESDRVADSHVGFSTCNAVTAERVECAVDTLNQWIEFFGVRVIRASYSRQVKDARVLLVELQLKGQQMDFNRVLKEWRLQGRCLDALTAAKVFKFSSDGRAALDTLSRRLPFDPAQAYRSINDFVCVDATGRALVKSTKPDGIEIFMSFWERDYVDSFKTVAQEASRQSALDAQLQKR